MIHPNTELRFINEEIGFGVFATEFIPKGTITWALDQLDQIIKPLEASALSPLYKINLEKYAYIDPEGNYVLCWDLGRYMNHSCNSSTRGIGYSFDLAVRDIQKGEELTYEYAHLNLDYSFKCGCQSYNCRGTISPDDIFRYSQEWDAQYAEAFALIKKVPQPLWKIAIEENKFDKVLLDALHSSRVTLPSSLDFVHNAKSVS